MEHQYLLASLVAMVGDGPGLAFIMSCDAFLQIACITTMVDFILYYANIAWNRFRIRNTGRFDNTHLQHEIGKDAEKHFDKGACCCHVYDFSNTSFLIWILCIRAGPITQRSVYRNYTLLPNIQEEIQ